MISLAEHNPELIKEWDYDKNDALGIKPDKVSYGSARKVWWKCDKGHSYLMGLNSRTTPGRNRKQCSVCAGLQVIEGYNDLYSKFPELMKEWDYDKNDALGIFHMVHQRKFGGNVIKDMNGMLQLVEEQAHKNHLVLFVLTNYY